MAELKESTKQKIKEIVASLRDDPEAAEVALTDVLQGAFDNIRRESIVRFEASCRGCGKKLLNLTEKTDLFAGPNVPTLVFSTGLDPHTCDRSGGRNLF